MSILKGKVIQGNDFTIISVLAEALRLTFQRRIWKQVYMATTLIPWWARTCQVLRCPWGILFAILVQSAGLPFNDIDILNNWTPSSPLKPFPFVTKCIFWVFSISEFFRIHFVLFLVLTVNLGKMASSTPATALLSWNFLCQIELSSAKLSLPQEQGRDNKMHLESLLQHSCHVN